MIQLSDSDFTVFLNAVHDARALGVHLKRGERDFTIRWNGRIVLATVDVHEAAAWLKAGVERKLVERESLQERTA